MNSNATRDHVTHGGSAARCVSACMPSSIARTRSASAATSVARPRGRDAGPGHRPRSQRSARPLDHRTTRADSTRTASRQRCVHVKQRLIRGGQPRTVARTTRVGSSSRPSPTTSTRAFVTRNLRSCFSAARSRSRARALEEDQLAAVAHEGSGERHQGAQRTDGAGGDGIQHRPARASPRHARARSSTLSSPSASTCSVEPGDAALHRLDQHPLDVRPGDRQHESGKTGAGADVADAPARTAERSPRC